MKKSEFKKLVRELIMEQRAADQSPVGHTFANNGNTGGGNTGVGVAQTVGQTAATGTGGGNTGGGDEISREDAAELKRNADLLSQAMSGTNRAKWYQFRRRLLLKINQMIIDFLG